MNKNSSRSSGLDELAELTKSKFTIQPQKRGISSKVSEQTEAIDKLTDLVQKLEAKLEAVEEEVQLADTDELLISPIAKFISSSSARVFTKVLGFDDGSEVEFSTSPVYLEHTGDLHHESLVFRLTSGKRVTAITIEFPSDPENVFEQAFIIDPSAPFIAIILTILNLICSTEVYIPRTISKSAEAKPKVSRRRLGAPNTATNPLLLPPTIHSNPNRPLPGHFTNPDDSD